MTGSATSVLTRTARLDFLDGLGISIGERALGMVHLVKRLATVTVQHHAYVPLPDRSQVEERRNAIAQAVQAFVKDNSIPADRTFVSLSRSQALLAKLSLPAAAKTDLRQVVEFELDRLIPIARDDISFDFNTRELGAKVEVQVFSLPRRVVGEVLDALELAEVRVRSLVITPLAILDFLQFAGVSGPGGTVVMLEDGPQIELDYFVRGEVAASHLVRAQEVATPDLVARLIARETLSAGGGGNPSDIFGLRTLEQPGDPRLLPEAMIEDGRQILARARGRLMAPEGWFESAPAALLPALGAALAAVREGATNVNLLPSEERRSVEDGAPVVTFLLAGVLALVALVWLVSAMVKDHRMASRLHAELDELTPQMRAVHQQEEEIDKLRERLEILTQDDRRRTTAFLKELSEIVPADAYLTTFRVRNDRVEVEGFARSASDLVPLLERSPFFEDAQFTSPVTKVQNDQERFSLTTEIAK